MGGRIPRKAVEEIRLQTDVRFVLETYDGGRLVSPLPAAVLGNLLCFHKFSSQRKQLMEGEAGARDTQPGFRLPAFKGGVSLC
jgi:hypothetical protein